MQEDNKDYKYILDDLSKIYIGARYSYGELMEKEDLSVKYRSIIKAYFLRDMEEDTTLESHLYYLEEDSDDFRIYDRLKARIRYSYPVRKKTLRGSSIIYKEAICKVSELVMLNAQQKEERGMIIRELVISKPALMGFVV